jgi:RNA polymerase sigma-70 factor (ECF subfamily)
MDMYRDPDRSYGMEHVGRRRWLRAMLAHDILKKTRRPPLEVSLENLLEIATESLIRLENWLAAEDSPPSENAFNREEAQRLLEALSKLPPRQREALILQKYHGWKLAQIAERLGCTVGAVAGLHARGLKNLRELLTEME